MQSLRDEMKLRDETRESENAKPAVSRRKIYRGCKGSGRYADGHRHPYGERHYGHSRACLNGEAKFGKELQLLKNVVAVMDDAHGILDTPDTGPNAIGAETEAIELLLQSKRSGSKGGGGGGSNPGGGGTGTTSAAALADLGPGVRRGDCGDGAARGSGHRRRRERISR